jgi:hypothetical protein
MFQRLPFLTLFGLLLAVAMTGCAGNGPDLVPERREGSQGAEGYCRRDENILTIEVRNQGNEDALSPSTVVVVFHADPDQPRSVTAPALAAGSSTFDQLEVEIPSGCFNPDCDFTITVDANDDIDESRENNNTEEGICIG